MMMDLKNVGPWGLAGKFSDDWIVSPTANRLFFFSVLFTLGLVPVVLDHVDIENMSFWPRLLLTITSMIGVVAILFLWFGMWRYWMRLDRSTKWLKRASFLLLLIGFWYGSSIYYFFVYLPQVSRGRAAST
jgi:hypothetical protein